MSNLPFLDNQEELDRYSNIVQQWIADVLEEEPQGTLQSYLADGAVLCRLAIKKKPGCIPKFHNRAVVTAMKYENIGKFLGAMLRWHGFQRVQLFQPEDIDRGNMKGVVAVLLEYIQKTETNNNMVTGLSRSRRLSTGPPPLESTQETARVEPTPPPSVVTPTLKSSPVEPIPVPLVVTPSPSPSPTPAPAPAPVSAPKSRSEPPLATEITNDGENEGGDEDDEDDEDEDVAPSFKNSYHVLKAIFSSVSYKELKENITGAVITPNDDRYETSRRVHNRLYNALPYLIVQPSCTQDVVTAIEFAKSHDWKISVKSGGYSTSGFCVAEDTLLLDMCLMNHIHVNNDVKTVTVQSGARWIDVLQATFPSIVVGPYDSSLGMGVILGGGFGPLVNSHGLVVDRVVSIEVVRETGEIVRCDDFDEKDLFFALRGGGGLSFGIVTSITLEMVYDVPYYISTTKQSWPLDEAKRILSHHVKVIADFTDRNLALITKLVRGKIKIETLYYGDQARSTKVRDAFIPSDLPPAKYKGKSTTYLQWCREHCSKDQSNKYFARSYLLEELDEDLINTLLKMSTTYPDGGECEITVEWLYGAFTDVSEMVTAFFHRGAKLRLAFTCYFITNDQEWARWTASFDAYFLKRCLGVCPNYTDSSLSKKDFPRLYWGDNYADLQAHKAIYDPNNFFSYPQSVEPYFQ
eukprot:TRINITY_DN3129_c0_g1_i1.p1 TRINITY_DN3129_c0_g1~~TRINITY_DN3129_c0_g1_i1.p1  ORF type:complete len:691 (+),score=98.54 TRINITY_DN3129_c0_g1_i1:28-2100(+)